MQVMVPEGLSEGQMFMIQTPAGGQMQVQVPPGTKGGMMIQVQAPTAPTVAVAQPVMMPQGAPPVGSSADFLMTMDGLFIRQQLEVLEALSGCETKNRYNITPIPAGTEFPPPGGMTSNWTQNFRAQAGSFPLLKGKEESECMEVCSPVPVPAHPPANPHPPAASHAAHLLPALPWLLAPVRGFERLGLPHDGTAVRLRPVLQPAGAHVLRADAHGQERAGRRDLDGPPPTTPQSSHDEPPSSPPSFYAPRPRMCSCRSRCRRAAARAAAAPPSSSPRTPRAPPSTGCARRSAAPRWAGIHLHLHHHHELLHHLRHRQLG